MNQALRTKALGAAAGTLVLVLAVSSVMAPATPVAAPAASGEVAAGGSAVVVLAGAPRDLDRKGLDARYAPIRSAKPFQARSFVPQPPARPAAPAVKQLGEVQPVSKPRDPDKLELRFSGTLGLGEQRQAILEEITGSGRGLLAKAGTSLGAVQVAAVGTETITVVDGAQRKDVALGDGYAFPIALASKVELLKPVTTSADAPVSAGTSARAGGAAPLSDDERKATLERLRARRRGQLPGRQEPPTTPPPATEAAPPAAEAPPQDPIVPTPEQLEQLQRIGEQLEQQLEPQPPTEPPQSQGGE